MQNCADAQFCEPRSGQPPLRDGRHGATPVIRRAVGRLLRVLVSLLPAGAVVPVLTGPLRGARWIVESGTNGCWAGTYERETQAVFASELRRGDVVFDLGANVGFLTLLAARLVGPTGKVYAFEPLPRNLRYLERHLEINSVANVTVIPAAVAATSGTVRFREVASPSMGAIAQDGAIEVRTVALDELMARGEAAPPRFMKIDIEGGEKDALDSASQMLKNVRPTILLSAHGYALRDSCSNLLRDAGYELRTIRENENEGDYVVLARPH